MDIRVPLAVAIHADEGGGYWGEVLALPGCYSQAETKAELLRNLREAATLYLTPTEKSDAGPRAFGRADDPGTVQEAAPPERLARKADAARMAPDPSGEAKAVPRRSRSRKPGEPGTSKAKR